MHFYVTDYQAEFRVRAPFLWEPYPGSRVHYLLKAALERVDREVREQLLTRVVPSPSPHRFLRAGEQAPAGLIPILPPTQISPGELKLGNHLQPGDTLRLQVRRFGQTGRDVDQAIVDSLDQLDDALIADTVGRRGPRERVVEIDDQPIPTSRVSLHFITPAHIKVNGKVGVDLTFGALVSNLRRRLENLCALYGELPVGSSERFSELLKTSTDVHGTRSQLHLKTWKRGTSEPTGGRTTHDMSGILGTCEFAGRITPFASTLVAAEEMNVGKMTSMGLGRIAVTRS